MTLALMERFASQGGDDYTARLLARMRQSFGGHAVKKNETSPQPSPACGRGERGISASATTTLRSRFTSHRRVAPFPSVAPRVHLPWRRR